MRSFAFAVLWLLSLPVALTAQTGEIVGRVTNQEGDPIVGDTLVYLMNATPAPIEFALPPIADHARWECLIDTSDEGREGQTFEGGALYPLADRSVAVFRLPMPAS